MVCDNAAVGEATVLDREVYAMSEAARLLGVRTARLRGWVDGYSRAGRTYEPVIRLRPTGSDVVTWGEFAEASYLREHRIKHAISLQRLRPAIIALREQFGVLYPLAHAKPYVADRELVFELQEELGLGGSLAPLVVVRNRQLILTDAARSFVESVEFASPDDGPVVRLYPDNRSSPVLIDPERAFGAPAIRGVRTETLFELFQAGESVNQIAPGYELDASAVEAALRYEARVAEVGRAA
jgi:uncharacterized protein (DUF433 family)